MHSESTVMHFLAAFSSGLSSSAFFSSVGFSAAASFISTSCTMAGSVLTTCSSTTTTQHTSTAAHGSVFPCGACEKLPGAKQMSPKSHPKVLLPAGTTTSTNRILRAGPPNALHLTQYLPFGLPWYQGECHGFRDPCAFQGSPLEGDLPSLARRRVCLPDLQSWITGCTYRVAVNSQAVILLFKMIYLCRRVPVSLVWCVQTTRTSLASSLKARWVAPSIAGRCRVYLASSRRRPAKSSFDFLV